MGKIRITRKLLTDYRKTKREIPVLQLELDLMCHAERDRCKWLRQKAYQTRKKMKQKGAKPEEKASKCIDIGKIVVLKKAGWSDKGIADEIRMEQAAVSSIIHQYIQPIQMGGEP